MNLTLQGGTAQQRTWVNEAISLCTYPLNDLSSLVITVNWSDQFPSGADIRHPYMVTTPQNDGSFLITIATWADDPGNPNNQGLPDPAGDIKDFYMQSVVHELGHVVIDSTLDPGGAGTDSRVQTCCGLFWTAQVDSGSGRRLGGVGDWSASGKDWPNMIKEAAAEAFKCAFFDGRAVFLNRTNWNIDESNWSNFLGLISDPGGVQAITYIDNFDVDDLATNFEVLTPSGEPTVVASISGSTLIVSAGFGYVFSDKMVGDIFFPFTTTVKVLSLPALGGLDVLPWFGFTSGGDTLPNIPPSGVPFWLRAVSDRQSNTQTVESWATDPVLGGTPFDSQPAIAFEAGERRPTIGVAAAGAELPGSGPPGPGGIVGELVLDYWRVDTFVQRTKVVAAAPYPFGRKSGLVIPGPAAQGVIRIGR